MYVWSPIELKRNVIVLYIVNFIFHNFFLLFLLLLLSLLLLLLLLNAYVLKYYKLII